MYNKLLQRQLQKHLGVDNPPENLSGFLESISASFDHYEQDRVMLERSIEISSEEMLELNQSQKKAHDELKSLFDNMEEVFFSVKFPEMQLLQMSPACEHVYGYAAKDFEVNPKLWYEVVLDDDKVIIDASYQAMFGGNSFVHEYRIHHQDGSVRWVETKIKPTMDAEKKLIRIDGITADITERKNAEIDLRESQQQIQTIFDAALDAIIIINEEGLITKWDSKAEKLFGWKESEVIGTCLSETIIPHHLREAHKKGMKHFLKTGHGPVLGRTIEVQALKKNNVEFDISLSICPSKIKDKYQFIGFIRDITERKKADQKLNASELRFRSLIENSADMICMMDGKGKFTYVSPALVKKFGFTFEECIAMSASDIIHTDDADTVHTFLMEVFQHPSQPIAAPPIRNKCKDGTYCWVEGTITNLLDTEGVNAIVANFRDVTERIQSELSLAKSENKYRELFEKMVDGVYKSSHEGKFIEVNPALVNMLGYDSKEELLAIDIKTQLYFVKEDREEAVYQDQIDGVSIFRLKKKDGSEIWVEDRGQYVSDENGNVLYHEGFLRDVTQRRRAEEKNLNNEKRFRSLIENNEDAIVLLDQDSHLIYQSPSVERMLGFSFEERQANKGLNYIHPDDLVEDTTLLAQVLKNPFVAFPFQHRKLHKDGHYIWTEGTATNLLHEKSVNAIVANYHDITIRKEQQDALEESNEHLKKSNTELDKFVYSVSHDLRAPLSSMLGVVEISEEETKDPLMIEHLRLLKGSIRRLDGFIMDILEYSRNARQEVKKEPINFTEILDNITENLKYMRGNSRKANIKIEINNKTQFVSDKNRINTVLNNLILNAIRYQNPATRHPLVNVEVDMSDTETNIIIKDNGIGISKENIDKIFEMFYRVSDNSVGSGLGLYIVKEAIDKLNGDIKVESEPGVGTTFQLSIPNLISK